jgi:hypothetical protein
MSSMVVHIDQLTVTEQHGGAQRSAHQSTEQMVVHIDQLTVY